MHLGEATMLSACTTKGAAALLFVGYSSTMLEAVAAACPRSSFVGRRSSVVGRRSSVVGRRSSVDQSSVVGVG